KNAKPISLNVKNEKLTSVLTKVFKGQPFDFHLGDNTITVSPKGTNPFKPILKNDLSNPSISSSNQRDKSNANIDISGIVVNEKGEHIAGATLLVKGTNQSIATDQRGAFSLKNVQIGAVLEFTATGYIRKSHKVTAGDQNIRIVLQETIYEL